VSSRSREGPRNFSGGLRSRSASSGNHGGLPSTTASAAPSRHTGAKIRASSSRRLRRRDDVGCVTGKTMPNGRLLHNALNAAFANG
jgi:hypothetical protein